MLVTMSQSHNGWNAMNLEFTFSSALSCSTESLTPPCDHARKRDGVACGRLHRKPPAEGEPQESFDTSSILHPSLRNSRVPLAPGRDRATALSSGTTGCT